MKAKELARLLLTHPDADIMLVDPKDASDYDFLYNEKQIRYIRESERFLIGKNVRAKKQ